MSIEFINGFTTENIFNPISIVFSISKFIVFAMEYCEGTFVIGVLNFGIQIDF